MAEPGVAALILAAGRSSRMGTNKLLVELDGKSLIAHAVDAALGSRARPIIVVTGHESEAIRIALDDRDLIAVHNPDYGEGLSSSLRTGLAALPPDATGVVVCLGDMPGITHDLINRLIDSFIDTQSNGIIVPAYHGRRGNPVLWARRFFPALGRLTGDTGGKQMIGAEPGAVIECPVDDDGVLNDIDTPDALAAYRAGHSG